MVSGKRYKVLALAGGIIFIDMVGYGIVIPILPLYSSSLGATTTKIGLLFSSYSLVFLIALLPLCSGVDKYGKRYPIIFGMLLLGVSSLLYAASHSLMQLTLSRLLQGFAAACTWAAALPLASQVTSKEKRGLELSVISLASGLGLILGPVIGGMGSFHTPFYISAVFSFLLALFCFIYLEEPEEVKKHKEYKNLKEKISKLLKQKEVQCSCLGVVLCWSAWGMIEVLFPLYLNALDYSRFMIGILFGVSGLTFAVFQPLAGIFSDRKGRTLPIILGLLTLSFFVPVPFHLTSLSHLLLSIALLGMVSAFVYTPTLSLIGDAVAFENQGVAFGLNTWMFSVSYLIAPWVGGIIADASTFQLPFYMCSLVLMVGSFIILKIAKSMRRKGVEFGE